MRKYCGIMLAVAVLAAGQARADGFSKDSVSATAKWVVHLDVSKFTASQFGTLVTNDLQTGALKDKLEVARRTFQVDPLRDLSCVTLYGTGYSTQSVVAIVMGNFNPESIEVCFRAMESYEATAYGDRKIHKVVDKKRGAPRYICFAHKGAAVIGDNVDRVKDAVDVLDGKKASLKTVAGVRGMDSAAAFVLASAAKDENGNIGRAQASVLKNADWLTLSVGETAGIMDLALQLGINTPENAAQIEQVVRGMVAFATLSKDPNSGAFDLSKSLSVANENGVVTVKVSGSSQDLYKAIKARQANPLPGAAVVEKATDVQGVRN